MGTVLPKNGGAIAGFLLPVDPGCEVESIFLNVEAVNTHRERPQVKRGAPPSKKNPNNQNTTKTSW